MSGLRLNVAAVLLSLTAAVPARADDGNSAVATELFNAGRTLMSSGDFAAACPKLDQSARLDPKVGTLGKLAECEEHVGHLVSARARWQQAVNLARASHDEREARCAGELARLDAIVPKVRVTTAVPIEGITVRVDDVNVGAAALEVPLPVEPGEHVVMVEAPGKAIWSSHVITRADGAVTSLEVPPLADEKVPPPPPLPPPVLAEAAPSSEPRPSQAGTGGTRWKTAGVVVIGAGALVSGFGAFLAARAVGRNDDSNKAGCSGNLCPEAAADLRNQARTLGNDATIAFVAGGALVAAGVATIVLAPSTRTPVAVRPVAGARLAGLSLEGRW